MIYTLLDNKALFTAPSVLDSLTIQSLYLFTLKKTCLLLILKICRKVIDTQLLKVISQIIVCFCLLSIFQAQVFLLNTQLGFLFLKKFITNTWETLFHSSWNGLTKANVYKNFEFTTNCNTVYINWFLIRSHDSFIWETGKSGVIHMWWNKS